MSYYQSVKNLHWNTVDVRGADGLLQLGRVIDCTLEGLMVDFDCGTGAQLAPFGQLFHSELDSHKDSTTSTQSQDSPVDVLIRFNSKEPAKWCPGILLIGEVCGRCFGLVRATTPSGSSLEIIPVEHIRERQSADKLHQFLLEKGQYVKEEIPLPSGISSGSPSPAPYKTAPVDQHIVDCFNGNCSEERRMATHVDGGVLHVLKVTDQYRWNVDRDYQEHSCLKIEGEELLRMLGLTPGSLLAAKPPQKRSIDDDEDDRMSTVKKLFTEVLSHASPGHDLLTATRTPAFFSTPPFNRSGYLYGCIFEFVGDSCTIASPTAVNNVLPKEILACIFSCLDGRAQVRLRRVCSQWNHILNTVPVCRVLRLPEAKYSSIPGVCLLNGWTAQTKIVVNTSLENLCNRWEDKKHYGSLMCSGRMFCLIMQEHHLSRLETLMLVDISWQWAYWQLDSSFREPSGRFHGLLNHICQELNLFASVCHTLVLKDVTVALSKLSYKHPALPEISPGGGSESPGTSVIVHITKAWIQGEIHVESLWNRMDSSLPVLTNADVDRWKEVTAGGVLPELAEQMVEVLNALQSADPRKNNPFSGKEWSPENLADLDLDKLNRITLYSLLKICCHEKLVFLLTL